jgi:hypothetical protein
MFGRNLAVTYGKTNGKAHVTPQRDRDPGGYSAI